MYLKFTYVYVARGTNLSYFMKFADFYAQILCISSVFKNLQG